MELNPLGIKFLILPPKPWPKPPQEEGDAVSIMTMKVTYRNPTAELVFLTFWELNGDRSFNQAMTFEEAEPYREGTIWDVEIKKTLVRAAE